jgi:hypothetical protein
MAVKREEEAMETQRDREDSGRRPLVPEVHQVWSRPLGRRMPTQRRSVALCPRNLLSATRRLQGRHRRALSTASVRRRPGNRASMRSGLFQPDGRDALMKRRWQGVRLHPPGNEAVVSKTPGEAVEWIWVKRILQSCCNHLSLRQKHVPSFTTF